MYEAGAGASEASTLVRAKRAHESRRASRIFTCVGPTRGISFNKVDNFCGCRAALRFATGLARQPQKLSTLLKEIKCHVLVRRM